MKFKPVLFILVLALIAHNPASAQPKSAASYPSLLWEITGNGLKKPSYLFGTMHVSSKLAFHLSDSFYYALSKVDAVALELNPELWQDQMVRLNTLNENYAAYVQPAGNDYLTESSFRISKYDKLLKAALSTEPPVVNSLLYRSYKAKEDFEEDTFLDLYIFQTGRKLGKAAAGVEDYYESEKLVMEAYADMAREKKRRDVDLDGESMGSLLEKMQNAYRRGDLDLMDSLDNMMERSVAFREKFLYKRNDIQADAIDSIIKTTSLFAGVGAAHLPGERGVIERLRKKGYRLRPIRMTDRDAARKDQIDQLKVKVNFTTHTAPDGMYQVDVPGHMYALRSGYQPLNRWQYADMNNGSYYLVTRVKTYASFTGQPTTEILKKVDSVLYENIPGKILSKKLIQNNGYNGYDISNKTRNGDLQRYQVFATPYEIIIFKMSGKNNYVAGEEAARFFGSIQLKKAALTETDFSPVQGGFSIKLPQQPHQFFDNIDEDRWEYEARDTATGDAYLLLKKSSYNFNFIEEDSFDLSLLEESFRSPDYFDKQLSRKQISKDGNPVLLVREKLKTGETVNAAYTINGPHYYVIAKRTANPSDSSFAFFDSFKFKPYQYGAPAIFTDTFLRIKANTPVQPQQIDAGLRTVIEQSAADAANGNNYSGYMSYWQKQKNGLFKSDSTGEMVTVQVQEYPKYFYIRDSSKFWQSEMDDYLEKKDLVIRSRSNFNYPDGTKGYSFSLQDTGSSRVIRRMILLKDRYMYTITTIADTLNKPSAFINSFFGSFTPYYTGLATDLYQNRLPEFFSDLFSTDSALHKKAQQSIANIYFGTAGAPMLYNAINRLSFADKDYFDSKTKMIAELGYIKDSVTDEVPLYLKKIYEQTADTSLFQNEAIKALARLKTKTAYRILKDIILQDPPVFEDGDYGDIFEHFEDTLSLSAQLFPDLLKLASLEDYKQHVTELLVTLVDSGFVQAKEYRNYFSSIYIDAKVAQKKQQAKDEKIMRADKKNSEDDDDDNDYVVSRGRYGNASFGLDDYGILMMPFYEKDKNVRQYFDKLLRSKDETVRMNTAVLLLRNQKEVPDSIFNSLAADDKFRGVLYDKLERAKRLDRFPQAYRSQQQLALSYLVAENDGRKLDSVAFLTTKTTSMKGRKGTVYFFKYRAKKTDDWKIGISGLQPLISTELSSDDELAMLTDKKIKEYEPLDEQLNLQLKRIIFSFHKSAKQFFADDNRYGNYKSMADYED